MSDLERSVQEFTAWARRGCEEGHLVGQFPDVNFPALCEAVAEHPGVVREAMAVALSGGGSPDATESTAPVPGDTIEAVLGDGWQDDAIAVWLPKLVHHVTSTYIDPFIEALGGTPRLHDALVYTYLRIMLYGWMATRGHKGAVDFYQRNLPGRDEFDFPELPIPEVDDKRMDTDGRATVFLQGQTNNGSASVTSRKASDRARAGWQATASVRMDAKSVTHTVHDEKTSKAARRAAVTNCNFWKDYWATRLKDLGFDPKVVRAPGAPGVEARAFKPKPDPTDAHMLSRDEYIAAVLGPEPNDSIDSDVYDAWDRAKDKLLANKAHLKLVVAAVLAEKHVGPKAVEDYDPEDWDGAPGFTDADLQKAGARGQAAYIEEHGADIIGRERPTDPDEAVTWTEEVADALGGEADSDTETVGQVTRDRLIDYASYDRTGGAEYLGIAADNSIPGVYRNGVLVTSKGVFRDQERLADVSPAMMAKTARQWATGNLLHYQEAVFNRAARELGLRSLTDVEPPRVQFGLFGEPTIERLPVAVLPRYAQHDGYDLERAVGDFLEWTRSGCENAPALCSAVVAHPQVVRDAVQAALTAMETPAAAPAAREPRGGSTNIVATSSGKTVGLNGVQVLATTYKGAGPLRAKTFRTQAAAEQQVESLGTKWAVYGFEGQFFVGRVPVREIPAVERLPATSPWGTLPSDAGWPALPEGWNWTNTTPPHRHRRGPDADYLVVSEGVIRRVGGGRVYRAWRYPGTPETPPFERRPSLIDANGADGTHAFKTPETAMRAVNKRIQQTLVERLPVADSKGEPTWPAYRIGTEDPPSRWEGARVPDVDPSKQDLGDEVKRVDAEHIRQRYGPDGSYNAWRDRGQVGEPVPIDQLDVYFAHVLMEDLPSPVLAEERDQREERGACEDRADRTRRACEAEARERTDDDERDAAAQRCEDEYDADVAACQSEWPEGGGYDWSELQSRGAVPPPKVYVNAEGTIRILDGNHRLTFWAENGVTHAPVWVIQELPAAKSRKARVERLPTGLRANPAALGDALRKVLRKPAVRAILGEAGFERAKPTWVKGGCWILAEALARWIGPSAELMFVSRTSSGLPDHVVVDVEVDGTDVFLDANGAQSFEELLDRWRDDETGEDVEVSPFNAELAESIGGMSCPVGAVDGLVAAFTKYLGPAYETRVERLPVAVQDLPVNDHGGLYRLILGDLARRYTAWHPFEFEGVPLEILHPDPQDPEQRFLRRPGHAGAYAWSPRTQKWRLSRRTPPDAVEPRSTRALTDEERDYYARPDETVRAELETQPKSLVKMLDLHLGMLGPKTRAYLASIGYKPAGRVERLPVAVQGAPQGEDPFGFAAHHGLHKGTDSREARAYTEVLEGALRLLQRTPFSLNVGFENPMALGCGFYGCAFALPDSPEWVIKVTGDPTEAAAWKVVLDARAAGQPIAGVARALAVFAFPLELPQPWGATKAAPRERVYGVVVERLNPLPADVRSVLDDYRYSLQAVKEPNPTLIENASRAFVEYGGRDAGGFRHQFGRLVGTLVELRRLGVDVQDVKGENVMQTSSNGDWRMTDLGIAHAPEVVIPEVTDVDLVNVLRGTVEERLPAADLPLFVYGTLRRGQESHTRLGAARFLGTASLPHHHRIQGPDIAPGGKVRGEVYGVDANTLHALDRFEDPWMRERVTLADGREVWVYSRVETVGAASEGPQVERLPATLNIETRVREYDAGFGIEALDRNRPRRKKPIGSLSVLEPDLRSLPTRCAADIAVLQQRYGAHLRPMTITHTTLDPGYYAQGVGVQMYVAAAREAAHRGALIVAHACEPNATTSAMARRVWRSQRFTEVADVVGFAAYARPVGSIVERLSVAASKTLYHGTAPEHLARILREGFRPRAETGVQRHATKTAKAVFLTDSVAGAALYSAKSDPTATAVVLEIDTVGLPLEPDYDDTSVILGVDADELQSYLQRAVALGEWEPAVGAVIPEDLVEDVEHAIQHMADAMSDRPEPFSLSVQYEDRDEGQVAVLYAEPTVGLPIESAVYGRELAELFDFAPDTIGYAEGTAKLMIQQYLCRCTIPADRIVAVWIESTAFPQGADLSGYSQKTVVDYDTLVWNEDAYPNIEDAIAEGEENVDFRKRLLIGIPLADAVRLLGERGELEASSETPGEGGFVEDPGGSPAAGVLLVAADTGRVLLLHRSWEVHEGGVWSIPGGTIKPGQTAFGAAREETVAETGLPYAAQAGYLGEYVWHAPDSEFSYTTFVISVPTEFKPRLNWENNRSKWATFADLDALGAAKGLHPAFADALARGLADIAFGARIYERHRTGMK